VKAQPLNLNELKQYIERHIGDFHANRLEKLEKLNLSQVLRRKNPYLFKAKNMLTADTLVRAVLDAFLSSQEETLFGDFMEGVAIFVCEQVFGGKRVTPDELPGVDLRFERDEVIYIVEIKSGPNWGNSSQIRQMKVNFQRAIERLSAEQPNRNIIAVNGCMYGKESHPDKGGYRKLCGQAFWELISASSTLYTDIIEPLGHQAKAKNDAFDQAYARLVNRFVVQFIKSFCYPDGAVDWEKLVRWTSQHPDPC